jgi:hypothetical protein
VRVLASSVISIDTTPDASYENPRYVPITLDAEVIYMADSDTFHVMDVGIVAWEGDGPAPEFRWLKRWEKEAAESALAEAFDAHLAELGMKDLKSIAA